MGFNLAGFGEDLKKSATSIGDVAKATFLMPVDMMHALDTSLVNMSSQSWLIIPLAVMGGLIVVTKFL